MAFSIVFNEELWLNAQKEKPQIIAALMRGGYNKKKGSATNGAITTHGFARDRHE